MLLPPPRGELSAWLTGRLRGTDPAGPPPPVPARAPAWHDDDLQLSLWCCYELHYRGFDDVDERWEWHPALIGFRGTLERRWLASLRRLAGHDGLPAAAGPEAGAPAVGRPEGRVPAAGVPAAGVPAAGVPAAGVPAALTGLVRRPGGPDLSGYLARKASRGQFAEYLAHRSVYQLKEADPHSFAIPRLAGPAKAALVEIQADEYGGGLPDRMHAELFRSAMRWAGLCDEYGYYVPKVPGITLALSNLMSVFALHRRWLGALLGHLAALEMTSTWPNKRYSSGARRLGADERARRYFDEHVEADAVHEQIAVYDLCGRYAAQHPDAAADILFGAECCLALDDEMARYLLSCWHAGRSSLRPLPGAEPAA